MTMSQKRNESVEKYAQPISANFFVMPTTFIIKLIMLDNHTNNLVLSREFPVLWLTYPEHLPGPT